MSLKYYRIDCTKLNREQFNEVEDCVDKQSYLMIRRNPHVKPDFIYAFFSEGYDFNGLKALSPLFESCTFTETHPDIEP